MHAGVVLSRPPLITRDLHPFEKAFFLYQRRLNERTALPFSRYFYYAKDTPGDVDWKRKIKDRQTAARDIGVYNAYRNDPWNDELLVGAKESEPEHQIEALVIDATTAAEATESKTEHAELEGLASKKKTTTVERPMPRVTESDKNGDVRSLNRALSRTLYLVVQGEKGWQFPSGGLSERESLHRVRKDTLFRSSETNFTQAAERLMVQAGGVNMNTWLVGNAPVGHYVHRYEEAVTDEEKIERLGEKTFYMKARILAGKPDLNGNALGLKDYKWLCKEELEKELSPDYYRAVRNMLVQL
ncbi:MAG: 39S ribosomal protein L46, mitochondrial [Stictis urceolatum]|nr:39S ribosomal protein L46, mitochondrial [Stictis urceolata]